jgi:hypothetical protein
VRPPANLFLTRCSAPPTTRALILHPYDTACNAWIGLQLSQAVSWVLPGQNRPYFTTQPAPDGISQSPPNLNTRCLPQEWAVTRGPIWAEICHAGKTIWAPLWPLANSAFGAGHTCRCPTSNLPCPCHPGTARLAAHSARAACVAACGAQRGRGTHVTALCPLRAPEPSPPRAVAPYYRRITLPQLLLNYYGRMRTEMEADGYGRMRTERIGKL